MGLFFWKKIKSKNTSKAKYFYEHNLEEWDYLGYTEVYWTSEGKKKDKTPVFFFAKKDDHTIRSSYIVNKKLFDPYNTHSFFNVSVPSWTACIEPLHWPIYFPSELLSKLMLDEYGCVWNSQLERWVPPSDKQKYDAAKKRQSETDKKVEKVVEENVVRVDFKKDEKTS